MDTYLYAIAFLMLILSAYLSKFAKGYIGFFISVFGISIFYVIMFSSIETPLDTFYLIIMLFSNICFHVETITDYMNKYKEKEDN